MAQPAALRFAIERDTLTATVAHFARTLGFEYALHDCSQIGWVEPLKQTLDGGLVRQSAAPKAQGVVDGLRLARAPFGNRQPRAMVGQHSDECE